MRATRFVGSIAVAVAVLLSSCAGVSGGGKSILVEQQATSAVIGAKDLVRDVVTAAGAAFENGLITEAQAEKIVVAAEKVRPHIDALDRALKSYIQVRLTLGRGDPTELLLLLPELLGIVEELRQLAVDTGVL